MTEVIVLASLLVINQGESTQECFSLNSDDDILNASIIINGRVPTEVSFLLNNSGEREWGYLHARCQGNNLYPSPSIMHVIHRQSYVSVNAISQSSRGVCTYGWDLCVLNNAEPKGHGETRGGSMLGRIVQGSLWPCRQPLIFRSVPIMKCIR